MEIPAEYLSDPDIGSVYEKYLNMVEEFKTLHKERETGRKVIFPQLIIFVINKIEKYKSIFLRNLLGWRNCCRIESRR